MAYAPAAGEVVYALGRETIDERRAETWDYEALAKPHYLIVSRLLVSVRVSRLTSLVKLCAPRAKLQFPKISLALGGGMWHTIFVLPLKGEITDYPRGSDGEQP